MDITMLYPTSRKTIPRLLQNLPASSAARGLWRAVPLRLPFSEHYVVTSLNYGNLSITALSAPFAMIAWARPRARGAGNNA